LDNLIPVVVEAVVREVRANINEWWVIHDSVLFPAENPGTKRKEHCAQEQ
jgi:hypothetical protein